MTQIPIDIETMHIGRKKETRIYYRTLTDPTGGEPVWIPTLPLPSDPWHLNHYTKKGFKLWPPGKEPGQKEVTVLQEQVKELEDKANILKEATAESETAKADIEAEVKILEEQASNLKAAVGEVKLDTSKGRISCPEPDCSVTVGSYIGLSRHMSKVHKIK